MINKIHKIQLNEQPKAQETTIAAEARVTAVKPVLFHNRHFLIHLSYGTLLGSEKTEQNYDAD